VAFQLDNIHSGSGETAYMQLFHACLRQWALGCLNWQQATQKKPVT